MLLLWEQGTLSFVLSNYFFSVVILCAKLQGASHTHIFYHNWIQRESRKFIYLFIQCYLNWMNEIFIFINGIYYLYCLIYNKE